MIHVIATIELVDTWRGAFLDEFRRLVDVVRQEDGCIEYGPAIDVATAIGDLAPPRADVVTVIEKWNSVSALAAHLKAPHMAEYRGKVSHMLAKVTIRVLEPA